MSSTRSIYDALASVRRARACLAEGSLAGISEATAALDRALDSMRIVRLTFEACRPPDRVGAECAAVASEVKAVAALCDRLGETVTQTLVQSSEGENTYGEPPGGFPVRRSFHCEV